MALVPRSTAVSGVQPLLDLGFITGLIDTILHVQRMQWEALATWQQSLAGLQQELWDEWVSRWAGGVPIDA
jgi:hypothetical protein